MGLDWARTSRADGYVRACDGYGDQRDREGDDDDDGGDLIDRLFSFLLRVVITLYSEF